MFSHCYFLPMRLVEIGLPDSRWSLDADWMVRPLGILPTGALLLAMEASLGYLRRIERGRFRLVSRSPLPCLEPCFVLWLGGWSAISVSCYCACGYAWRSGSRPWVCG